jgi:hypothetical protein
MAVLRNIKKCISSNKIKYDDILTRFNEYAVNEEENATK